MKILIIILLLASNNLLSQNSDDIQNFRNIFSVNNIGQKWSIYNQNPKNEIDMISTTLFIIYKNFISSQDSHSCSFTPSCSEYAIESIRKNGFFIGGLDAFDRLSRCHGLSPELYIKEPISNRLIDPVE